MPKPRAREATTPALTNYLDGQAVESHERLGEVAGVAVTVALGGKPVTVGASSRLARDVDEMQYVIGRGPCLHALVTGDGLYVPDLAADERWGDYGPRAAALGAASCLSLPIEGEGSPVGVFKIYAAEIDGLSETQRALGHAIAGQLTDGLGLAHLLATQAEELDDRVAAMDQRRSIDVAIGIVMERISAVRRRPSLGSAANPTTPTSSSATPREDWWNHSDGDRIGPPRFRAPGLPGAPADGCADFCAPDRPSRSRARRVPAAVAAGKTTVPANGMLISRKVGIDKPNTRGRLRCIAARRSASRNRPRRSKVDPISSRHSIQPPNAAETTGTTVCPTTGTKPPAKMNGATSAEMAMRISDCRRLRPIEAPQLSAGIVKPGSNSRSTNSEILS